MLYKVRVNNYKSLASVVVELGPFNVLVGPNGAGKSNFVDALRFVSDCLRDSVAQALRSRGNIGVVRRHSRGHPTNIGFRLLIQSPEVGFAEYAFELKAEQKAEQQARFAVKRERCIVEYASTLTKDSGGVTDELLQKMKNCFTDAELVNLTMVIGLYNLTGRFLKALRIDIEDVFDSSEIKQAFGS